MEVIATEVVQLLIVSHRLLDLEPLLTNEIGKLDEFLALNLQGLLELLDHLLPILHSLLYLFCH